MPNLTFWDVFEEYSRNHPGFQYTSVVAEAMAEACGRMQSQRRQVLLEGRQVDRSQCSRDGCAAHHEGASSL
jgi:hypothetical protein